MNYGISKKLFTLTFLLSLILFVAVHTFVFATDTPTPSPTPSSNSSTDQQTQLQQQIKDLQSKVSDLEGQAKTLTTQIAVMDNRLQLTQLRIDAKKQQIDTLLGNIDIAGKKINNLEGSLSNLTKVLLNRIVTTYEVGSVNPFHILLSSNNVETLFSRLNYLKIVQEHDKQLVYETEQAKNDYKNTQQIFEDQKKEVELQKAQLEDLSKQLDQEKKDKKALLAVTQNNEAVYQQRLQTALAEQKAIQSIAAGGGNAVAVGPIHQGDIVGYMISGHSACSSGTHLHYEVHRGDSLFDPASYLDSHSVIWDNSPDGSFGFSGSTAWPLEDPIRIEQGYGMTYWARSGWYGGGPHTGIDMYSDTSLAVHAVKDGQLFRGGIACGSGQLLFARVDQSDGVSSYYLHIVQ